MILSLSDQTKERLLLYVICGKGLINTTMTKIDYIPFNYFTTPILEIPITIKDCEEYGLNYTDVSRYVRQMAEDRRKWQKINPTIEVICFFSQIIGTIITISLIVVGKLLLCQLFGVYNDDSILFQLFSFFAVMAVIISIYVIWKWNVIRDLVYALCRFLFQKRSQYDSVIEKFLEDCYWEGCKKKGF